MNFTHDVFMSHSSKDKDEVSVLRNILGKEFRVWFSYEGIEGSDKWVGKIKEGITNSAVLLVFWTKNASESEWVGKEILEALAQRKPIIPMLLDDTPLGFSLIDTQAIPFHESYVEGVGKLGRRIKDLIGISSQALSVATPWKYESKPSPWNNFFEQNGYLQPETTNFALNSSTRQLRDRNSDEPLTRFVTIVAAPVPYPLEPIDLLETFASPEVIYPLQGGIKAIGKPDPDRPWRWFNLVNLQETPGYKEIIFSDPSKEGQKPFPAVRYLRFTEDGAIEYVPRSLTYTSYRDPGISVFKLLTLIGEANKFLSVCRVLYEHWGYRGDFQLLVNLINTRKTLLAEFASGWENEDYSTSAGRSPFASWNFAQPLNIQISYRINAGVLSNNIDIGVDLVDDLSRKIQSGFGLRPDKRHLEKHTAQFPWAKFYDGR